MKRPGRLRPKHPDLAPPMLKALVPLYAFNVPWAAQPVAERAPEARLFSQPAMTSAAPSRLARFRGATILPSFFRRRADDSGYVLRFHAPLPDLPSDDAIADTARLTAVLEGFIRECPEQYFWTHRKFKDRPGEADAYRETDG